MALSWYCCNCGYGETLENADKVVERCRHCPRLEAYKGMKLFVVWYESKLAGEQAIFVGVYTSEAKANNDAASFKRQRDKLVYSQSGVVYVQTVEPNQMMSPKVFA